MSIASRLDEAMKEAGFASQSALARASGVPQPTINRILSGDTPRGPETETVRKLAQACGVAFSWLNEGVGARERLEHEEVQGEVHNAPLGLRERLRHARTRSSLTQKALAQRCHIAQSTISELESGQSQSSSEITAIAAALGVNPLWLATGRGLMEGAQTVQYVDPPFSPKVLALAEKLALIPEEKLDVVAVLLGIKLR